MPEFKVVSKFTPSEDQERAIDELAKGVANKLKYQTLLGVTGSGKTYTMAKVIERVRKPALVLTHNKTLAAQLYREFKEFFPDNAVEYFVSYYDYYQPEAYVVTQDLYIEKDASINDEIDRLRLKATSSIIDRDDTIVVSSVSCIYGLGSPVNFEQMQVALHVGDELDRDGMLRQLIGIHYERNDVAFQRGTFRVRGDTVDIYPAYL
nr:DEAD/DEAH box helicase family protein [Spirochaetota bacterium]